MFWRILLYPPIFLRRYKAISREVKETLINEEIRFKELRVVSDDGQQLGIMSSRDAMKLAKDLNDATCASLRSEFGEKSAFLERLAQKLLVRCN